jgi:hypothetical protein
MTGIIRENKLPVRYLMHRIWSIPPATVLKVPRFATDQPPWIVFLTDWLTDCYFPILLDPQQSIIHILPH